MIGGFGQLPPVAGPRNSEIATRMLQEVLFGRRYEQYFRKRITTMTLLQSTGKVKTTVQKQNISN